MAIRVRGEWGQLRRLADMVSRRREAVPLLLLALVAFGLWAFVELADALSERQADGFDRRLLLALRSPTDLSDPLGPSWAEEVARDITALGGVTVLGLATAAVVSYLALLGKRRAAVLVAASTTGGWVLSFLLKAVFDRPRPNLVPHETVVYSASFPSGHSMMSAVTYLTLAGLLAGLHAGFRVKASVVGWALLLTLLTGFSRVYLGVHWPTDVLAGWCLGASWALLCWTVALWLRQRGRLREDPADAGTQPAS
jgi:undecaprenyl-diphosphatase